MYKIKLAGIYKIEHISGYYYIGMSIDIFGRWAQHYTDIKKKKHSSPKFQELFTDPTEWTFVILEYVSKTEFKLRTKLKGKELDKIFRNHLMNLEREWMKKFSINYSLNKDNKYFS